MNENKFTHGSLFSGIGGFDLAAEWMGWDNIFHCEWNPFGQKVLKHYWPKAKSYADITKTDFTIHRGTIDILTGGFPCQPYSLAGKRKGKEDERHLWPEMLRAIREIQPSYVVGENVSGLINWNGGMVFDEVQAELEAQGYEVTPFVLPAASVNAPHRRDRVWFVAHRNSDGQQWSNSKDGINPSEARKHAFCNAIEGLDNGAIANSSCGRLERWSSCKREIENKAIWSNLQQQNCRSCQVRTTSRTKLFDNFPSQSPVLTGDDGLPTELDGITFSKWRNESIKAGGNAIVPQVALQIFKAIEQFENYYI